jgi:TetR/AcrR family transcriptional regulator
MPNVRTANTLTQDAPKRSSHDTVTRILAVAEKMFAENGVEGASLNDIAERAGISKANIFHHFRSKRELYLAVLRNACACEAMTHLETHAQSDAPFSDRFKTYAQHALAEMLAQEQLHRLIMHELLADTGKVAKEITETVFKDKFTQLVTLLRAGQDRGELRTEFDPAMAVLTLVGANILFLHFRHVMKQFPDVTFSQDAKRYSALLTDVLLNGLLAPTAPTTRKRASVRRRRRPSI